MGLPKGRGTEQWTGWIQTGREAVRWYLPRNYRKRGIVMFGLGMPELLIIMFICLIVFGGRKLPELGSGLGKAIRDFRSATKEIDEQNKVPGERKNPS